MTEKTAAETEAANCVLMILGFYLISRSNFFVDLTFRNFMNTKLNSCFIFLTSLLAHDLMDGVLMITIVNLIIS